MSAGANDKDLKNLSIEFKSDNTVDVKEDGQITQTSTWRVQSANSNYFSLFDFETTPKVSQLSGSLVFCNKRRLFHQSQIDGCDNYFKREDRCCFSHDAF